MLPTPSWLKFRRWRARKAATKPAAERHEPATQSSASRERQVERSQPDASRDFAPHSSRQLEARKLERQLASSCESAVADSPASTTTTSASMAQRNSRPRRKLAHLIPRSLSNLIGRALSPASSINQSANNNEHKQPSQRHRQLTSEDEMTTSKAACCLQAPDLIAQAADSSAGRPKSPLRKVSRHLACGQQQQQQETKTTTTSEREQALETMTQVHDRRPPDARTEEEQQQQRRRPTADQKLAADLRGATQRGANNDAGRQDGRQCQAPSEAANSSPRPARPLGRSSETPLGPAASHASDQVSQSGAEFAGGAKSDSGARGGRQGAETAAGATRLIAKTAAGPDEAAAASCHLTARTRDNQCALHGSSSALDAAPTPAASSSLEGASRGCAKSAQRDDCSRRAPERRWRRSRKTPRTLAKSVPTWPLAKQTLDNNLASELQLGHFGDAEDLLSAHLAGRLFGALTADSLGTSRVAPPAGQPRLVDQLRALNYNHKRPFARAYETPTTGWIFNATGLPPINAGSSAMLNAKLFASSGFRRRSYDDQEGDNDFNIILQPSDIEDIEREAKASYAQFRGTPQEAGAIDGRRQLLGNNNDSTNHNELATSRSQRQLHSTSRRLELARARHKGAKLTALTSIFEDIKLANCLLDQDYNQTVRLFIERSALNWNFNSFTFDALCCGRSLTELLLHLFDFYNLYATFQLDMVKVLKCFRLLEFGYHSTNPYHNSVHAADVTQAMHCFIQEQKIRSHMSDLEVLSSILAAVCHDLDHPGVSQSFLVATKNPLASLYANSSVLENHHWRFALCIFKESQLFDHLDAATLSDLKEQLKQLILATDIARQNEYLKRFREMTSSCHFSMSKSNDRALVLQMALKCADLGNPCRPWMISRVWSNLICDEFYRMGQIERRLGIPLTPICQRHKTSIAGIQTDFFRFIVLPLLELWHGFLDSPLSELLMANFYHNYKRWQRASRIVQQLRRRKSVACLEPLEDRREGGPENEENSITSTQGQKLATANERPKHMRPGWSPFEPVDPTLDHIYMEHSFNSVKRASSDYVKSGNGWLESMRDFQLNQAIEKSPQVRRAWKRQRDGPTSRRAANKSQSATEVVISKEDSQATVKRGSQKQQQPLRDYSASGLFRQALSPIQDGDAASPDQLATSSNPLQDYGRESPLSTGSSPSSSSACSSPADKSRERNFTLGAGLNARRRHQQQQQNLYEQLSPGAAFKLKPGPVRQSGSSQKGFYNMRRRESDPGALTDELAAAIVLIQYQSNNLYHKRRSSLPICVARRRSSK